MIRAIRLPGFLRTSLLCIASFASFACGGGRRSQTQGPESLASGTSQSAVLGGTQGGSEDIRSADLDHDGRPEVFKHYKSVSDPARPGEEKIVIVRQDVDLNWDGKIDIWRYFSESGAAEKEEWDLDYDGRVDEVRTFENGVIAKSERDRNNDGRPDVTRHYKAGKLDSKETDTDDDGKVDRWEYFSGQVLDRIGIDKDHDGTVDSWSKS